MPKLRTYSESEKDVALSMLEACKGDAKRAAKLSSVPEHALRSWQKGEQEPGEAQVLDDMLGGIPMPPAALLDELRYPEAFVPCYELPDWVTNNFLDSDGALYNEEHWHLATASIGFLWTNVGFSKQGCTIAGTAELPMPRNDWASMRWMCRLKDWFGEVPDALITFDSVLWASANNATRCARLDHELFHLAIRTNQYGEPCFDDATGRPRLKIRGHDVEEFVGVWRRYGPGAAAGMSRHLMRAGTLKPLFGDEEIDLACGTCL